MNYRYIYIDGRLIEGDTPDNFIANYTGNRVDLEALSKLVRNWNGYIGDFSTPEKAIASLENAGLIQKV